MNETPSSDALLWEVLPDLTLNIAQTAALCGISVRQLGYWTRQSYVTAQGQGARRTYGLEAVRHVLAIHKAMDGGASLRQALRSISIREPAAPSASPALASPALASPALASPALASPALARPTPAELPVSDAESLVPAALSSVESHALARCLRAFFETNRYVRDHAGGLAVKIGRAEDDVRVVAESLCGAGILVKEVCQGMTIFHQARREASHA